MSTECLNVLELSDGIGPENRLDHRAVEMAEAYWKK